MTATLTHGHVTCLDGFVSKRDCGTLCEDLEFAWWWASPVVHQRADGRLVSAVSAHRTSRSTSEEWLDDRSVRLLRRLEHRLAERTGIDPDHLEMWQAARYRRGEHFGEHHDAGFFGADPWGERSTTIVVYLNDSRGGGSTSFPLLGLRFAPLAGRVLVWPNLLDDGSIDARMRHEASPARSTKTTLTTWERQRATR